MSKWHSLNKVQAAEWDAQRVARLLEYDGQCGSSLKHGFGIRESDSRSRARSVCRQATTHSSARLLLAWIMPSPRAPRRPAWAAAKRLKGPQEGVNREYGNFPPTTQKTQHGPGVGVSSSHTSSLATGRVLLGPRAADDAASTSVAGGGARARRAPYPNACPMCPRRAQSLPQRQQQQHGRAGASAADGAAARERVERGGGGGALAVCSSSAGWLTVQGRRQRPHLRRKARAAGRREPCSTAGVAGRGDGRDSDRIARDRGRARECDRRGAGAGKEGDHLQEAQTQGLSTVARLSAAPHLAKD